jgi:hypothetical protein
MAKLFPRIDPSEIENPGERIVARALLEQLPSRVEVFHSFNWIRENERGTLQEGECDFVVLDPERGLLFVEVKGGTMRFDPDRMVWLRQLDDGRQRKLKKDPFDQVRESMHEIVGRIRGRAFRGDDLPFPYGYAVAFPQCVYEGSLPPAMHPVQVLDAHRCEDLNASVGRVLERFGRFRPQPLNPPEVSAVHEALYPRFAIVPVVWRRVEDQEMRLQRLTDQQQHLLQFLQQQPKARIEGVAGSGKTILALAKAQELARAGVRTLLLCYNRPLKEWLEQSIPETFDDTLVIDTFHGITSAFCQKAGVRFDPKSRGHGDAFWSDQAPELLMEACALLGPDDKFDAIVVDEGQDFHDLWWTAVDDLFRDAAAKACYYVFYDPKQNIYVDEPGLPEELGPAFQLPTNCRNTVKIAQHCAGLVDVESAVRDGAPTGDDPEFLQAQTLDAAFKIAGKKVREWCMPRAGNLKLSQVAVLAPSGTERQWPKDFRTVDRTKSFDAWRQDKGVLVASWARFKGLEADAIVIIEDTTEETPRETAHRYVARSRAKHLLVVVSVGGEG